MKYKVIQRKNPQEASLPSKYYAVSSSVGKFTVDDFAQQISGRSSLTSGDIKNVLDNFLEELPVFLKLGLSIQLAGFGTMRLSLSSDGADTAEEFTADKIKGARIIFTPSPELKKSIKNIKYEQVR